MELTKKKQVAAASMAGLLLCSACAATSVAYLTAQSNKATNTFVAAPGVITNNEFTVNESKAVLSGGAYTLDADSKVTTNSYDTVVPGMSLPKDPAVTANVEDGVSAYIFVEVEDTTKAAGAAQSNLSWAIDPDNWQSVAGATNVYAYKNIVVGGSETELNAVNILKNKLVKAASAFVDTDLNSVGFQMGNLSFKAYAIQASGFNSAAEAWAALSA